MGRRFQNAYTSKCTVCKMTLHQQGIYCQTCAYSKGPQWAEVVSSPSSLMMEMILRGLRKATQ